MVLALLVASYFFVVSMFWLQSSLKQGKIKLAFKDSVFNPLKKWAANTMLSLLFFAVNFLGVYYGFGSAFTQLAGDKQEVVVKVERKYPGGGKYSTKELDLLMEGVMYNGVHTSNGYYAKVQNGDVLRLTIKRSVFGIEFYFK